jgi:hypothetical protein
MIFYGVLKMEANTMFWQDFDTSLTGYTISFSRTLHYEFWLYFVAFILRVYRAIYYSGIQIHFVKNQLQMWRYRKKIFIDAGRWQQRPVVRQCVCHTWRRIWEQSDSYVWVQLRQKFQVTDCLIIQKRFQEGHWCKWLGGIKGCPMYWT